MRWSAKVILTFSIFLVLISAVYFVVMYSITRDRLVGVTEEEPLRIGRTSSDLPLDPLAAYWVGVESVRIHLWPQNARVPYGTEERDVWVRGAYNDREIALLVEFEDDTEDRDASSIADACAVFLGPAGSPAKAQMMGQDAGGNIWHWLADRDAERYRNGNESVTAVLEFITSGPGTQWQLENQTVAGKGEYRVGRWYVVFKRSLTSQQEGGLELARGSDPVIAFAVWDGAKMESFAAKSISIVRTLILDGARE